MVADEGVSAVHDCGMFAVTVTVLVCWPAETGPAQSAKPTATMKMRSNFGMPAIRSVLVVDRDRHGVGVVRCGAGILTGGNAAVDGQRLCVARTIDCQRRAGGAGSGACIERPRGGACAIREKRVVEIVAGARTLHRAGSGGVSVVGSAVYAEVHTRCTLRALGIVRYRSGIVRGACVEERVVCRE